MKNVKICDISLLSGTEKGSALNFKEKLEISKRLSDLKVDVIEIDRGGREKSDDVLIKTVCACVKNTTLCCDAGNTEESVEEAYKLIASAKSKRLVIRVPVSPVQIEYFVSKKPKALLELLAALVKKAKSLCDGVEVEMEDATRAEEGFLYQAIEVALGNGANVITVSDAAGVMLPDEFGEFIKGVTEKVQGKAEVGVKVTDVYSMGAACYLKAVLGGATLVKLAALGKETPSFIKFVCAINAIGDKRGLGCGINKTALSEIVDNIKTIAGKKNGDVKEVKKPDDNKGLNKNITKASFITLLKKRGYDLSAEDVEKVYAEVKRVGDKKEVTNKDLDVIVASTAMQVPSTYKLKSFVVNSSNMVSATASVVLEKDGQDFYGLSYGNGAIDAAFLAIENITGKHFELDDFVVVAVTEGKEAMGETVIKLREDGVLYSGRGVSTDIVGASIRAYVNALNKIVYEEK